jgi:hypothetical protein
LGNFSQTHLVIPIVSKTGREGEQQNAESLRTGNDWDRCSAKMPTLHWRTFRRERPGVDFMKPFRQKFTDKTLV